MDARTDSSSRGSDPGAARLVLTTAPDADTAERLAQTLVAARLAACANIVAGVTSIYRWEAGVERDSEQLLVIKSTVARLRELEAALLAAHPYDCPEFVVLEPSQVGAAYAAWLRNACAPQPSGPGS